MAATIWKRHNYIFKMLDEIESSQMTQKCILQAFTREFQKRFSKNPYNNVCLAVPLSKDIIEEDNRCLIRDPTTDEVWLAVKQISL